MDYLRALGSARMALNHSRRNDVALYSSDRIAQLTGNGLLTLTPRIPGFEVLFRPGEVVYFNDVDEAVERVRHYAAHPDEAAAVAEAGWRRAHAVCAADRVARFMEDFVLSNPLREAYEWRHEIYGRR
jgi:spore maturation protein CgeB